MFLTVKTASDAAQIAPAVRAALASIDASQPFADVQTLDARLGHAVSRPRTSLMLASVLAVLALTLAVIGLYGVLSYGVARRTREFGIRIALGASPTSVRGLVLREGLKLTMTGAILGVAGAAVVVQIIQTALYGTATDDLRPYALAVLVILTSSAIAYWIPARRARDTDASTTLRADQ
jgi:putative ABC transport system permease protein